MTLYTNVWRFLLFSFDSGFRYLEATSRWESLAHDHTLPPMQLYLCATMKGCIHMTSQKSSEDPSLFALSIKYSVNFFFVTFFFRCCIHTHKKCDGKAKKNSHAFDSENSIQLFWVLFSRFYSIHFDAIKYLLVLLME